jgi:hypothetical protein
MKRTTLALALYLSLMFVSMPLPAAYDETELAKKARNPVADLISIPIQSNFDLDCQTDIDGHRSSQTAGRPYQPQ